MQAAVPIPKRMRHLPKDARGLPIPATVYRDDGGVPHFAINDEVKRLEFLARDLCPMCAKELNRARWFVGGPLSAFDPRGMYIDLPVHHECATYSLEVCPYLAARSYSRRVDTRTLEKSSPDEVGRVFLDPTMIPERPEIFVAIMCVEQTVIDRGPGHIYVAPVRPPRRVEFWRNGSMIAQSDGMAIVARLLSAQTPATKAPRLVTVRP